jgi:hypothetical protein
MAAWGWPDHLDPVLMQSMGQVTLALLRQPERWIHRRTERINFIDRKSAHHQVSVDFTLPNGVSPIVRFKGEDVYVAPLFMLAKDPTDPLQAQGKAIPMAPFSHIALTDESGRRLPLLTRRQSGRVAAVVLAEAAIATLGRDLPPDLAESISDVAQADKPHRMLGLEYIFSAGIGKRDVRHKLRDDPAFRELAYALSSHSIIVCLFTDGFPDRSMVQLAYDEPLAVNDSPRWAILLRSLGWKSEQLFVSLNEIGASASYHVEIDVPKELEVNATGLYGTRYEFFGHDPQTLSEALLPYDIWQAGSSTEGNIYVPEPRPGRRVGAVFVKLRARRPGFLRSALAASIVTALVLFTSVLSAGALLRADRSEAAVALLLLIPTIMAAWVARSDEHAIATKMLVWARIALMVDAALPFAAALFLMAAPSNPGETAQAATVVSGAGMLTVPMAEAQVHAAQVEARQAASAAEVAEHEEVGKLRMKWIVLTVLSLVLVAQFVASYRYPRPRGETRYRPMPKPVDSST